MAAKKQKPPIHFYDIETVRDALRWLKQTDSYDRRHDEAERLEKQFPEVFKLRGSLLGRSQPS